MEIQEIKDRLRIAKSAWLVAYNHKIRIPYSWEDKYKEEFGKYDESMSCGGQWISGRTSDYVMRFEICPLIDKLIKFNCL